MRVAGMIATFFVLVAVGLGLVSLVATFGYRPADLFGLLWPVAVGSVLFVFVLFGLGRWSANALIRRAGSVEKQDKIEKSE